MQIQLNRTLARYPMLVQMPEHEESELAPTDIWQATYVQGPTVDEDRLEGPWTQVAARKRVREHNPCFIDAGQAAYIRADRKKPGLFVGKKALVTGPVDQACFSSDAQLAFSRENALWLAQADGSLARRLDLSELKEDPKDDEAPRIDDLEFSPDGCHLWFCAGTNLYRYELASESIEMLTTRDEVREFTVGPHGRTVAYLDTTNGIHRLSLDEANLNKRDVVLTQIPYTNTLSDYREANVPASPTFTPDGSRVLFTVSTTRWYGEHWDDSRTTAALFAMASEGGESVQLTDYEENISRLAMHSPRFP